MCQYNSCYQRTTVIFDINHMPPVTNVRVWWDASVSAYRVSFPYNKELVEFLGKQIPVSDRHWDSQTNIWTCVERTLTPLLAFFKLLGVTANVITRQQMEQQAAQQQARGSITAQRVKPLDTVLCEFMRLLPYTAAQTAYRKAAMELHPDRGGDAAKAAALNDSWSRIAKEVYGQQ
jgi:hypothetical protein